MNQRFSAFLAANHGNAWKSNTSRNAAFICFIMEMKTRYLGSDDRHITDHDDFTAFIWRQVNEQIKQAA